MHNYFILFYFQSFAVDPNEILSRERGTKTLSTSSPTSLVIKQEPMTPTFDTNEEEDDLNNNNNNMEEDDLNNLDFPTPQSHNNHSFNFYAAAKQLHLPDHYGVWLSGKSIDLLQWDLINLVVDVEARQIFSVSFNHVDQLISIAVLSETQRR